MAYRIEGKDIVIAGFEQGIADTPYAGTADMRNVDIISVPGEAMAGFSQAAVTAPVALNATAYTAQDTGDTITIASTTGLYVGTAIVLSGNTATGLSNGIVYYVFNIVGNTFQVRLAPASGSAVAITSDGTGTLTTYQYGRQRGIGTTSPNAYFVDRGSSAGISQAAIYLTDASNYAWVIFAEAFSSIPANTLVFLGNIGGNGAASVSLSGIAVWNGYVMVFGLSTTGIDVADVSLLLAGSGPAVEWDYGWETPSTGTFQNSIPTLVSQEDGNLYFLSNTGLGSIIETPNDSFDPSDSNSYTITDEAVLVAEADRSTCIAELGSNILIGGRGTFVYIWDKISLGFSGLLNIPDATTYKIVASSQNAYVFAGTRGRIYITNGSGIDLFKKVPDYVTGTVTPYIRWRDASFGRNQLYFAFSATNNAGNALTTVAGAWAIDLESKALRLVNKVTNTGYAAITTMVAEMPAQSTSSNNVGNSLIVGWYNGSTYGIDCGASTPYTNYESYIQTDMIPVGTYLNPFSPSQLEWKTSVPLGGSGTAESIRISYRQNLLDNFTVIGTSTGTGTTMVGTTTGTTTGANNVSDVYQANLQKVQWVQFLVELASNATTPTYCRLTEIRIRDWPSGT